MTAVTEITDRTELTDVITHRCRKRGKQGDRRRLHNMQLAVQK
jgi:hypothetical protein